MAKKIKAIKCPHCGSVDKQEVKDDHYLCRNCGTEYFLDSDDININHHYPHQPFQAIDKGKLIKGVTLGAGAVFGFLILVNILGAVFSQKKESIPVVIDTTTEIEEEDYYWSRKVHTFYLDHDQHPTHLLIATRRSRRTFTDDEEIFVVFYDMTENKEVARVTLDNPSGNFQVKLREFEDGALYFIKDNRQIFKVNKRDKMVSEITPDSYSDLPDLSVGFAKVEFIYQSYGDGFQIMTNEGKQVYLYPGIRKVYTKDEWYEARRGFRNIPTDTPERIGFSVSSNSHFYPEEKIHLVKYRYKSPVGYPKERPHFGWDRNYGGSGIFTDASPYKKEFISQYNMQEARVLSYEKFTPDRLYFSPSILDYNEQFVLIVFKPTPAEDETYSVQLMDAETGEIHWTYPTGKKSISDGGRIMDSGYRVGDMLLGMDGKFIHRFELPE